MSSTKYRRLSKDDAAVLFVDHQCGLLTLVQDYTPSEFKNAVLALADTARYFKLPTILTTSFEEGPNGPIVPELKEMFPDAPFIARPGQINAWDNEDFVKAVAATGRKQLIIAGIVTEVCVAFPALCMLSCATRSEMPTSVRPACRIVVLPATSIRSEPGFALKRFCCAR